MRLEISLLNLKTETNALDTLLIITYMITLCSTGFVKDTNKITLYATALCHPFKPHALTFLT